MPALWPIIPGFLSSAYYSKNMPAYWAPAYSPDPFCWDLLLSPAVAAQSHYDHSHWPYGEQSESTVIGIRIRNHHMSCTQHACTYSSHYRHSCVLHMIYTSHSTIQQRTTPTHLIHCMHINSIVKKHSHKHGLAFATGRVEVSPTILWICTWSQTTSVA